MSGGKCHLEHTALAEGVGAAHEDVEELLELCFGGGGEEPEAAGIEGCQRTDACPKRACRLENGAVAAENDDEGGLIVDFIDAAGQMCGSLLILDVESVDEGRAWAAADPYAKAGLFESVLVQEWKKVVG